MPIPVFSQQNPDGNRAVKAAPPLNYFPFWPSRLLWWAQVSVHLLLACAVFFSLLPALEQQPWWSAVLLLCWMGLFLSLQSCFRDRKKGRRWLAYRESGWHLLDQELDQSVDLVGESVVWPWLVVLHFRKGKKRQRVTLVLLPDSASSEDLRRLRVWLRTSLHHSRRQSS